jgi:hypothetical protein
VHHPLTRAMALLTRQTLPGRNQPADQVKLAVRISIRCWRRWSREVDKGRGFGEAVDKGGGSGVALVKEGDCGEAVLPMVELARGRPEFSLASSAPYLPPRPLCRLTLPPLQVPPAPPELSAPMRPWPGLDLLGAIQAGGGLILGLIALFTSYDHLTFAGQRIGLQQQWGIPLIAASVAVVLIDSQLASRSRLRAALDAIRAAQDAARSTNETARERNLAREERQRADQERNRAAEARERQRESFERLDQAALLSARVQLAPSPTNRARLRAFLTLMAQRPLEDGEAGMA